MDHARFSRVTATARAILSGAATYAPFTDRLRRQGTGGTVSARYCYSVWLRHLVHAHRSGLAVDPKTIAELGPGDSLGMGLCAILTGADRYFAFDVVEFANLERNRAVLNDLIPLVQARSDIPGPDEFPDIKPALDTYEFPAHILTPERMGKALAPDRVEWLKRSLSGTSNADGAIQYRVPWFATEVIEGGSVDLIFSQAALEHVVDLPAAYSAMQRWLKPRGYLSHQIDLRCHGTAKEWNGHWTYSPRIWKLIQGARPFLLNRQPAHRHIEMLADAGFQVINALRVMRDSSHTVRDFSAPFDRMPDEDLHTSGLFVQATKVGATGAA